MSTWQLSFSPKKKRKRKKNESGGLTDWIVGFLISFLPICILGVLFETEDCLFDAVFDNCDILFICVSLGVSALFELSKSPREGSNSKRGLLMIDIIAAAMVYMLAEVCERSGKPLRIETSCLAVFFLITTFIMGISIFCGKEKK